jgi:hypothetical protein
MACQGVIRSGCGWCSAWRFGLGGSVLVGDFNKAIREFVGAFEVVFGHDWDYSKWKIGQIKEGATFIDPDEKYEMDDWWARGALLQKYRDLLAAMKKRNMEPAISDELHSVMDRFRHQGRQQPEVGGGDPGAAADRGNP